MDELRKQAVTDGWMSLSEIRGLGLRFKVSETPGPLFPNLFFDTVCNRLFS